MVGERDGEGGGRAGEIRKGEEGREEKGRDGREGRGGG